METFLNTLLIPIIFTFLFSFIFGIAYFQALKSTSEVNFEELPKLGDEEIDEIMESQYEHHTHAISFDLDENNNYINLHCYELFINFEDDGESFQYGPVYKYSENVLLKVLEEAKNKEYEHKFLDFKKFDGAIMLNEELNKTLDELTLINK